MPIITKQLATFYKPQGEVTAMRFVRCYDPILARIINRFDIYCGVEANEPMAIDSCVLHRSVNGSYSEDDIQCFINECLACVPENENVDGIVEHHSDHWISYAFNESAQRENFRMHLR